MNTRFDGQLWIGAFGVNTENIMQLYTTDEAFRN